MQRWGVWLVRALGMAAAAAIVVYVVDSAAYKLRGSPQGTVVVSQFLSVPLKGQKIEYDYQGSANASCAKALFPHGGLEPCWHLRRNPNQWEKL